MNKKVPIIIAVILFVIGIILYFVFRETKQKEVKSDINYLVIGNESIWENKNNSWNQESALSALEAAIVKALDDPLFVGIGEIGLDFFVPEISEGAERERQEFFYQEQLKMTY